MAKSISILLIILFLLWGCASTSTPYKCKSKEDCYEYVKARAVFIGNISEPVFQQRHHANVVNVFNEHFEGYVYVGRSDYLCFKGTMTTYDGKVYRVNVPVTSNPCVVLQPYSVSLSVNPVRTTGCRNERVLQLSGLIPGLTCNRFRPILIHLPHH